VRNPPAPEPTPEAFQILTQPSDESCGPTCLHAVYRFFGDDVGLEQVIEQTRMLREGGTLASLLGIHALGRGYRAVIHPYNLDIWDPTWFDGRTDLADKLRQQLAFEHDPTFRFVTNRYLDYMALGGEIEFRELTAGLIRSWLRRGLPIMTTLSATYLYMEPREVWSTGEPDDVRGEPSAHFVIIFGLDRDRRHVTIADPLGEEQPFGSHVYHVKFERLIGAILLGVLSFDSGLLVLEPGPGAPAGVRGWSGRPGLRRGWSGPDRTG
jgi:hypothetical protein